MDDVKNTKKQRQENRFYTDSGKADKLEDQVKKLYMKVKSLEQYKDLCEERIKELSPTHPIPIKEEHLGLVLTPLSGYSRSKERISRIEPQKPQRSADFNRFESNESNFSIKYNELLRDKLSLEESLRAEMLTCEEQRAYIEILKQALENNSEFSKFS